MKDQPIIAAWSEQQRLLFIERLLFWRGTINRRDLCDYFGISLPQATNDLVAYSTLNPGACQYDVRRKCYVATAKMQAVLREPNFGEAMEVIGGSMRDAADSGEFVLRFSRPQRRADQQIQRKLSLAVCEQQCLEVSYWSVSSGQSESRWMSPRAFGYDGLRWHVRAYCHREGTFRDFVIGRFQKVLRSKDCPHLAVIDDNWLAVETLVFRASEGLKPAQRTALEMDYGMVDGSLRLPCRRAMRIYALRRLGFVKKRLAPPMLNELKQLEWFATED
jgi:hypothetical protein